MTTKSITERAYEFLDVPVPSFVNNPKTEVLASNILNDQSHLAQQKPQGLYIEIPKPRISTPSIPSELLQSDQLPQAELTDSPATPQIPKDPMAILAPRHGLVRSYAKFFVKQADGTILIVSP